MDDVASTTPARLRTLASWVLNQAAIAANRLTDRALADAGTHRHQFAMLATLDEFGPSSQADLGRCTAIDRSDVAAAVNAMAERGFVQRSRDPDDGRRNIVTLTPAGKDHLERLGARLAEAQDELLRALSATESKTLIGLLARLIDTP